MQLLEQMKHPNNTHILTNAYISFKSKHGVDSIWKETSFVCKIFLVSNANDLKLCCFFFAPCLGKKLPANQLGLFQS